MSPVGMDTRGLKAPERLTVNEVDYYDTVCGLAWPVSGDATTIAQAQKEEHK